VLIERLWPEQNRLRNYQYLVACGETGDALAIDPLDAPLLLAAARRRGWQIRQILNTHHHRDHTAGNAELAAATGARILAHEGAAATIGGVDVGLAAGASLRVGRSIEFECLDTPGHTLSHLCLFAHAEEPVLFSGDTLFNAGVGNCHGGSPDALFDSFANRLARLPDATRVMPGHDYLLNNLAFTLDREPSNPVARSLMGELAGRDALAMPVTTLAEEKTFNTFLRLRNPEIVAGLRERFPTLPAEPSPREVFLALRELRNGW
jgi:hydroxyacylglutathione hydrolase